VPAPPEPVRPDLPAGPLHPGGSGVPRSDDVAREQRRYARFGGDHVARYRWVAADGRSGRLLDIGCGHGFGSLFLGPSITEYVGLDVDPSAIEWARRCVLPVRPGATFELAGTPPPGQRFDTITCFEVLEHVHDPAGLLRSLRAACAPGGAVYLSTPNGTLSAGRPEWFMSPFHLEEFALPRFRELTEGELGGAGRFFLQRRYDGLDWMPAAIRAGLGRHAAPTGAAQRAEGTPRGLRRAHEGFRRLPSPPGLWHQVSVADATRERRAGSHLLWRGTPKASASR
jgi:SAM-dependent methyltransferase